MALHEMTVAGYEFELDIPDGFVITGMTLLVKSENPDTNEICMSRDSEGLNYLERVGIYTHSLEMEINS